MKPKAQVAHVTFSLKGGAGVVASRLNEELNNLGVSSRLYTETETSLREAPFSNSRLTFLSAVDDLVFKKQSYAGQLSVIRSLSNADWLRSINEEVIVLHWVEGLVSVPQIQRWVNDGKRVFWYVHDNRPLTGGCHTGSCTNFLLDCGSCPVVRKPVRSLVALSRRRVDSCRRLGVTFLAPSDRIMKWSEELGLKTVRIRNPVSEEFFSPQAAKDELDPVVQERDANLRFACVARDLKDPNKGVEAACRFFDEIYRTKPFWHLELIGEGIFPGRTSLGNVSHTQLASRFRKNVDVLLFFSEYENAPLVILEAAAAGVLVVCPPETLSNLDSSFQGLCLDTNEFKEIIKRGDFLSVINRLAQRAKAEVEANRAQLVAGNLITLLGLHE